MLESILLITIVRSARSMRTAFPMILSPPSSHSLSLSGFYAPQYELLDPRTGRSISQGFKIIRYGGNTLIITYRSAGQCTILVFSSNPELQFQFPNGNLLLIDTFPGSQFWSSGRCQRRRRRRRRTTAAAAAIALRGTHPTSSRDISNLKGYYYVYEHSVLRVQNSAVALGTRR